MDASIIVCTYNRADSLRDTLAALRAQQTHPEREWEVIVVDNNSKDHTRTVVEEIRRDWPRLRYEFEGAQGLSHARNHGITCATGDVILFTDDDVLPESDWIEVTLAGLQRYNAEACGGYIEPIWQSPPPAWLKERFYGFLAVRNERSDDYLIDKPELAPFGANMVVRKAVFDQVGLFDTGRGRTGKSLASGEDGEMFERILAAGIKVVFLGRSRVHHKVESFRCTKAYFRRWRYQTSSNLAVSRGVPGSNRLFNVPLYMFPQLLRALGRAISARFTQTEDESLYREIIVAHFLGTINGLFQSRKSHQ
jgi:glycosyltransferase involved in cell wall biosynthesis